MSGGLAALLDDIAAMAKLAAASVDDIGAAAGRASAKAAGVVVDDAAVTPRYVTGFTPDRELPMIKRIAKGSIINKMIILVAILALSTFIPWILTPLLMIGGLYLSFEGAEKLWEKVSGHSSGHEAPVVTQGGDQEQQMVKGAIRTDFILSAEIMVIALSTMVLGETLLVKTATLIVVAIAITVGVYGVVALIVKMDDIGLKLATGQSKGSQAFGNGLVKAMPKVLTALSIIGTIAMLWVGGHILLVGASDLGWTAPYAFVHHLEEIVHHATGPLGGFLGWVVNTFFSFVAGVIVGSIIVVIMHLLPFGKKHDADHGPADDPEKPREERP
jgi:predicted DNA repair protein MutK